MAYAKKTALAGLLSGSPVSKLTICLEQSNSQSHFQMPEPTLSKRERQIMDIVFQLGKATAADVHERLPDPPTYTAVRTMLKLLEDKGLIRHEQEGRKYIYSPCHSQRTEGRSALTRVLQVFFGGSLENAISAHLSDPKLKLDSEELERLKAVIDEANDKQSLKSKRSKK